MAAIMDFRWGMKQYFLLLGEILSSLKFHTQSIKCRGGRKLSSDKLSFQNINLRLSQKSNITCLLYREQINKVVCMENTIITKQ